MSVPSPHSRLTPISRTSVPTWTRSAGLTAGGIVAIVLATGGLLLGRIDLALLALPLIVALAWTRQRRPATGAVSEATLTLREPRDSEIEFTLAFDVPTGVEAVVVRSTVLGGDTNEIVLAAPVVRDVTGSIPLLHSGLQELVRFEYRFLGTDAGATSPPAESLVATRVISPARARVASLPLPLRLRGLTGSHESARAGDGGDFRDIHPFAVGDRLRRIDWKTTARRGQNPGDLYVRRTSALSDATVLIVLDSRDDVGEQVAQWTSNIAATKGVSALDVAREAASSLATAYIQAGDRVGFQDLSSRNRMVAHAGGHRHLRQLLRAIEVTQPSSIPYRRARPPIVPPGALVYVLSSLLDDEAVRLALRWRVTGHRVVVVDVLPAARFARTTRAERLAHRIVVMQRDDRIRAFRQRGVEYLRWPEEDNVTSRRARLQILSRPTRGAMAGGRR
ncbi:MAG TPA: DUF58 domain-containing protein [Acidimicrobiales bacterium]|nr:DUF58 domain-containing protein [Acidimicrobiales bacterium]